MFPLALFPRLVCAAAVVQAISPLQLQIERVGNSGIKGVLTNADDRDYKLLRAGSILDENLIEKSQVFSQDGRISSDGIHPILHPSAFTDSSFEILLAGDSIELEWDVAADHDLSAGGDFTISSSGFISYAEDNNSTTIGGVVEYESNDVKASINGDEAAAMHHVLVEGLKRASVQSDCQGNQRTAVYNSLKRCRDLALWAEKQARGGSAERMNFFFKKSDSTTRNKVGDNFRKVAQECGSPATGFSKFYCSDIVNFCQDDYIAYTTGLNIVQCPLFWRIPGDNKECRANTQTTTTIHEVTHLSPVLGSSDHDLCYGIDCIRRLPAEKNINHADTYSFFAQSASSGCI